MFEHRQQENGSHLVSEAVREAGWRRRKKGGSEMRPGVGTEGVQTAQSLSREPTTRNRQPTAPATIYTDFHCIDYSFNHPLTTSNQRVEMARRARGPPSSPHPGHQPGTICRQSQHFLLYIGTLRVAAGPCGAQITGLEL